MVARNATYDVGDMQSGRIERGVPHTRRSSRFDVAHAIAAARHALHHLSRLCAAITAILPLF